MPTRYIKKNEKTERKALAVLQTVCDSPDTTTESKQQAAQGILDFLRSREKVEPLRTELAQRMKQQRAIKEQLDFTNEQLTGAQNRITELEKEKADLSTERDGLKGDLSRMGAALSQSRTATRDAEINASKAGRQAAEANSKAENLKVNLQTLLFQLQRFYGIKFDEAFTTKLFFGLGDNATIELFIALGWTEARFDYWSIARNVTKNKTTEQLIEFLHPAGAGCVSHRNVPKEEDQRIVEGLLRSRGVAVETEVHKLQLQHLEEYRRNNPIPSLDLRGPVVRTPIACNTLEANRYAKPYSSDPEA